MAKKVDLKAKQKRQKIIAAVGGVLLLGILAIQVPKTMKMLNAQPPPTPVPTATTELTSATAIDSSALPTPGAVGTAAPAPGAAATSGDGQLGDSDPAPAAGNGQLVAFDSFASKDPFKQQVKPGAAGAATGGSPAGAGGGTGGATGGGSGSGASAGGVVGGGGSGGSTGGPGIPDGSTPGGAGAATSAVIAVNGVEESVTKGNEFPKDAPVFRLVSLTSSEAKIAIAGGALASGARAISLKRGKTLTLVNTADGTRYELKLVSTG